MKKYTSKFVVKQFAILEQCVLYLFENNKVSNLPINVDCTVECASIFSSDCQNCMDNYNDYVEYRKAISEPFIKQLIKNAVRDEKYEVAAMFHAIIINDSTAINMKLMEKIEAIDINVDNILA